METPGNTGNTDIDLESVRLGFKLPVKQTVWSNTTNQ